MSTKTIRYVQTRLCTIQYLYFVLDLKYCGGLVVWPTACGAEERGFKPRLPPIELYDEKNIVRKPAQPYEAIQSCVCVKFPICGLGPHRNGSYATVPIHFPIALVPIC